MSTPYKVVHTNEAPGAVAPYSQAVVHNGIAYVSGCIPFTTEMKLVEGGIEEQTEQAMNNLFAVVKAAGSEPSHILKCTIFMKDMNNFAKINEVYERRFSPYKPARSAVEVARLPKDVGVEIECIAAVKSNL
ncbi:related to HMF1 - Heat-shock induceable Inhibitor of cell Growth [Ustilago bromivora]|uniref:Related to HMF1 - Heat-shock induceable Inhibitor of cell Growth n=1 Tax=Ustilago bromivora TaxID=307758 RepID=A0A8H8QKJ4_9BASI|nr:related to HMF1 - Heat-shock induceable Inhibitor of cell Growth [Ustilago bromivora]